uniref:Uncharacterized protein AlNc14C391G11292 n=1 Tax=Albugo laibachii Nc14 TaxID=890382 RepID=F0WYM9_9STRA|nr:conserved hypothetical protein [Albugo laibachii Nc14]|eukprot:CCA26588.1 conserved hypothetical protein [Albugo laibachii Nc14]
MRNLHNGLFLCQIGAFWITIQGANWAQISGNAQTNSLVVEKTPWANRHGHAVATLDFDQDAAKDSGRIPRVFLIGGDTSTQSSHDLRAYPGGGGLKNDVWVLSDVTMTPTWDRVRNGISGNTFARTIAHSTWTEVNSGRLPPEEVTYDEWIACALNPWVSSRVEGCEDVNNPPGVYLADIMFSPRRNFAAVMFKDELYILGGRARDHSRVPEDQLRGGVRTLRLNKSVWREYAVLKNDVWKSNDNGATWKLVTPGCKAPQSNLVHKNGDPKFSCQKDSDCERDAICRLNGRLSGTCICKMWSPREYHSVSVYNNALYLSGGYALVQYSTCGSQDTACGGGYRTHMNDVWRSIDGEHWQALNISAAFVGRGEHAMVPFQGSLYIMGGRSGDSESRSPNALLNDVWKSIDGSSWTLESLEAPWSPRAKHSVVVLPGAKEELLLMFGETEEGVLGDVWSWKGGNDATNNSSFWSRDFSPSTLQADYIQRDSDIRFLIRMTEEIAVIMYEAGIYTIRELASLSFDRTIELRQQVPTACDFVFLARYINEMCAVSSGPTVSIQVEQSPSVDDKDWDGCSHHGKQAKKTNTGRLYWPDVRGVDQVEWIRDPRDDAHQSICRWSPPARTGQAATIFQGRPIVLGGLVAANEFINDVWTRIASLPNAQFTLTPRSRSSETMFQFISDKPGCTFQYHVLDMREKLVVRGWTSTLSSVDSSKWLDPGLYRLRVRAVDPSGNVDKEFESGRNEHIWIYKRKPPYALIFGLIGAFVVICIGGWMEWKKRKRRQAMERYALQRLRRKKSISTRNIDASDRESGSTLNAPVIEEKLTLKKDVPRYSQIRPKRRIVAT